MARLRVLDTAVRANTTHFERGMKRASTVFSRFSGLIVGYVGARTFKRLADDLDKVAKTSAKLGISGQKLMEFHHAASLTGVSTETFNMALQRMTRRVAEAAQGTGEARNALKELNLDAQALGKLPLEEQFLAVADAMGNVAQANDRVRLAMKLFDSEGVALVNTLALGRAGLDKAGAEFRRFAGTYSEAELQRIERMNDNLGRLQKVFVGIGASLLDPIAKLAEVVGYITGLSEASWEAERGILGLTRTVLKSLDSLRYTPMPGISIGPDFKVGGGIAAIDARLRQLWLEGKPGAPGAGGAGAPAAGPAAAVEKLSEMAQTGQAALGIIASGFDVVTIKAQGFGAVVQQVASSLASMASQTFAQYLLSQATGGFVPNPLSVDVARKR